MNDILPCFPILQYELNTLSFKAFSRLFWRFLYQIGSFLVQFTEQEFMNAYNLNEYCVTYGSGDFGCNLNKILRQQIEVYDNKRLPYKLPCSTRSSRPEESHNNTREKIWYFFTRV